MRKIKGIIAMLMVGISLNMSVSQVGATEIQAFDPNGTYEAYLGLQTQSFSFRNPWDDASYGLNGTEWEKAGYENRYLDGLCGWENNLLAVSDVTFEDCVIDGNGTYSVKITDFDFGNDTYLNTLFVSTTIPLTTDVSVSDVNVIIDGAKKYTFDKPIIGGIDTKDAKNYIEIQCINIWDTTNLGGKTGLFSYGMPVREVEVQFTINGFTNDHVEAAEEVEAVDANTDSNDTSSDDATSEDTTEADSTSTTDTTDASTNGAGRITTIIGVCAGVVVLALLAIFVGKKMSKKQK